MIGLYIHIPFCRKACHYCDFHFSTSLKHKSDLINAIQRELELRGEESPLVDTIYFGGGTPSLLDAKALETILETIYKTYRITNHLEITFEANPEDITRAYVSHLKRLKINRLSVGIQSFFEEELSQMNRSHSAKQAKEAMRIVAEGFNNFSVDLIYGFPKMSKTKWKKNIEIALSYNPKHLSAYALTIEPRTALHWFIRKGKYPQAVDKITKEHYDVLVALLKTQGYQHYEISNFAKQGFFSQTNTAYWAGKHYIGIGPSAHSFDGNSRKWNVSNNNKYIKSIKKNICPLTEEILSESSKYNEYIMTGLRTMWGVSLKELEKKFGLKTLNHLIQNSKKHIATKHLECQDGVLKILPKGRFLSDGIISDLFRIEDYIVD